MPITVRVNGEERILDVAPPDVLLDVLRTGLGITSPKVGCERGDCGACTVLLDGRTVRSCLVLAVEVDRHEIVTVEGLGEDEPAALVRLFVEHSAFQCGFCAPGIVLAAVELLRRTPAPTRHQVQEALSGNLCRCTGYESIVDAVLEAAGERAGAAAAGGRNP